MNLLNKIIDKVVEIFNPYSVLTHEEIQKLITKGYITADREKVNATSVDVTLHQYHMTETQLEKVNNVYLNEKETPNFTRKIADDYGWIRIEPRNFILGATCEIFNLPDNITAVFYMKSSLARCGLDHCNAGFIDPGFNGSRLTLELTNLLRYHTLVLQKGMPIGQIKFYRHKYVPKRFSYRTKGQYNGDMSVQDSKGVR